MLSNWKIPLGLPSWKKLARKNSISYPALNACVPMTLLTSSRNDRVSRTVREGPPTVRPYMVFNAGAEPVPDANDELNDGISSGLVLGIPNLLAQSSPYDGTIVSFRARK